MSIASLLITACTLFGAQADTRIQIPERAEALGQTREHLQRSYDRLSSPPLSDLEFVLSDVSFRQTRRFTEYSGDVSGRMLGALGASAATLGIEDTFGAALMKGFAPLQKADGHFGIDQNFSGGVDASRDTPILWGNSRLLLALAQRARLTGDAEALKMARAIGDYIISTRQYYGRKENFGIGEALAAGFTTCYPAMIDGLVALGEVTGDKKYWDEARFIAGLSLLDKTFEKHHSHGRLTAFRGMLDLDRVTGKPEFLEAVRSGVRSMAEQYELPTGGIPEVLERTYPRDEGCSNGDWLRVDLLLWQATGEGAYLDAAEHTLNNHILASRFSNGGYGHRPMRTLRAGEKNYRNGGFEPRGAEAYWCCSMHVTQMLADVARWSIVSDGSGLLVTWLGEVHSTFKVGGHDVTAEVRCQRPGQWKVTLTSSEAGEVRVRLRVPHWASELSVDGKTCTARDGWAEVKRSVKTSDSLDVQMKDGLGMAGVSKAKPASGDPARLFVGPQLLCLPDVNVGDGMSAPNDVPTIALPPVAPGQREVEALLQLPGDKWQVVTLVPTGQRPIGGCRVLFHVQEMNGDEFKRLAEQSRSTRPAIRPAELSFAAGDNYEVYLNGRKLGGGAGWGESLRFETYLGQGRNVLLVRARGNGVNSGMLGFIAVGSGRPLVTKVGEWSAAACPAEFKPEQFSERLPADGVALKDLGTWGSAPWGHMPAQFAGTGARWIWPETSAAADKKSWWVFRYEIP